MVTSLKVLEDLLLEVRVEDLTVGRICRAAGISRSTFYREFDNIDDAVGRLFDAVVTEMVMAGQPWLEGTSLRVKPHLEGVYSTYLKHGPLMRAAADAELGQPTSKKYRDMMEAWDALVGKRLAESFPWVEAPMTVAHALNAAGERIMYYDFAPGRPLVSEAMFETTTGIMYKMWCSALHIAQDSEVRL